MTLGDSIGGGTFFKV